MLIGQLGFKGWTNSRDWEKSRCSWAAMGGTFQEMGRSLVALGLQRADHFKRPGMRKGS